VKRCWHEQIRLRVSWKMYKFWLAVILPSNRTWNIITSFYRNVGLYKSIQRDNPDGGRMAPGKTFRSETCFQNGPSSTGLPIQATGMRSVVCACVCVWIPGASGVAATAWRGFFRRKRSDRHRPHALLTAHRVHTHRVDILTIYGYTLSTQ